MGEEEKYTITKSPAFWIFVEEVQMSTDGLQVNNVYTVHQMYVLHDMALFTVYIYIYSIYVSQMKPAPAITGHVHFAHTLVSSVNSKITSTL